jgi:hypothetical protein
MPRSVKVLWKTVSKSHLRQRTWRSGKNSHHKPYIIWWSIGWIHTRLNNFIRTFLPQPNFCHFQACNPTVWYFSVSHGCITRVHCDWRRRTSVTSCVLLECLTAGRSDVITPVGVTSSWCNHVIAPVRVTSLIPSG